MWESAALAFMRTRGTHTHRVRRTERAILFFKSWSTAYHSDTHSDTWHARTGYGKWGAQSC